MFFLAACLIIQHVFLYFRNSARYSYHLDNYRFYTLTRFVPIRTYRLNLIQPLVPSPHLLGNVGTKLHNTSIRLTHVLTKHCESSLDIFNRDIAHLDAELKSSCPITRYDQFMSETEAGLTRLESVVCTRRNNKIGIPLTQTETTQKNTVYTT